MPVSRAAEFFAGLELSEKEKAISRQVMKEIRRRLEFLNNVGLDYITIDRESATLAGGWALSAASGVASEIQTSASRSLFGTSRIALSRA
jgi:excinuclease UvrABC ATPase subunit